MTQTKKLLTSILALMLVIISLFTGLMVQPVKADTVSAEDAALLWFDDGIRLIGIRNEPGIKKYEYSWKKGEVFNEGSQMPDGTLSEDLMIMGNLELRFFPRTFAWDSLDSVSYKFEELKYKRASGYTETIDLSSSDWKIGESKEGFEFLLYDGVIEFKATREALSYSIPKDICSVADDEFSLIFPCDSVEGLEDFSNDDIVEVSFVLSAWEGKLADEPKGKSGEKIEEWINGVGDKISEFFGEYTGVTIGGTTSLLVISVIVIFIVRGRRRRR